MNPIAARVRLLIERCLSDLREKEMFLDDEERNQMRDRITRRRNILNDMLNQLEAAERVGQPGLARITELHPQILSLCFSV